MCFAIPGLILSIDNDKAVVSYNGERKNCVLLVDAKIGDYVIVQSDFAVSKIGKAEAAKIFEAMK
jgi:hydrogenase assembly chaperone HypC/HupF